jgi:soluble lytic murein transglycosylase-like protein
LMLRIPQWFLMMFAGSCVLAAVLSIGARLDRSQKADVQIAQIQSDVAVLKLTESRAGAISRLADELLRIPAARKSMEQAIPQVAGRVLYLAEKYRDDGVTVPLVLGIVEIESGFDAGAVSRSKAYGLMQVVRSTATPILRSMDVPWSREAIMDPVRNLDVGTAHVVALHRQFQDEGLEVRDDFHISLLSYNFGERPVRHALDSPSGANRGIVLSYWAKVNRAQNRWREKF